MSPRCPCTRRTRLLLGLGQGRLHLLAPLSFLLSLPLSLVFIPPAVVMENELKQLSFH